MSRLSVLIFTLMVGFSSSVFAQAIRFKTDADAPVDIVADSLVWQQQNNQADLSGGAKVTQGALTLSADFMQIFMGADGTAQKLMALGQVTIDDGAQTARAMQADYDLQNDKLRMSGDVRVTQKADNAQLSGAMLQINMTDGKAKLSGGKNSRARIKLGN